MYYIVYVYSDKLPYKLFCPVKLWRPGNGQNAWPKRLGAMCNNNKYCANSW